MLHQGNDIAALIAAATIPNLLFGINCEPIGATALWARPLAFDPTAQFDTAPLQFAFNWYGAGSCSPIIEADSSHRA
jgi:hypothetical protein